MTASTVGTQPRSNTQRPTIGMRFVATAEKSDASAECLVATICTGRSTRKRLILSRSTARLANVSLRGEVMSLMEKVYTATELSILDRYERGQKREREIHGAVIRAIETEEDQCIGHWFPTGHDIYISVRPRKDD